MFGWINAIQFVLLMIVFLAISVVVAPYADARPCGSNDTAGKGRAASAVSSGWTDYQIVIWQAQSPARLAGLGRLGITAGKIFGERLDLDRALIPQQVAPFLALGLGWYIENIATDFYAAFHRWHADRPVNALFNEVKRLHRQEPTNLDAFIRTPSLSNPGWLHRIAGRLREHVCAYARYQPLFYNLADEAGVADLAAAWDFDFAPESLAGFRVWLKAHYASLAPLNREWGTRFSRWSAVMPMTTDAALQREDQNFAAWADFKEWMDVAFARAVRAGTDAVHAADPRARAGLEGGQVPGWGGYDYSRLALAVDVMELYDHGNNVEIARSLAPGLITLTTSSLASPQQVHAVWHALLLGGRGLILWDEDNAFVDDAGTPTARGVVLGAVAAELRSGLAAQLIASAPATDPVAILYSPASQRTQWLLDRRGEAKPWVDRDAEIEFEDDNRVRAATRLAVGMLTHLGVQPRWLTDAMVGHGALRTGGIRVLVLPHTIALSRLAARRIREFVRYGGVVLTDTEVGQFDAQSRHLVRPLLADLTGTHGPAAPSPELWRAALPGGATPLLRLRQVLERAEVEPGFALTLPDRTTANDVNIRVFQTGTIRIIGLQRDTTEGSGDVVLGFKTPVYVYNLRHPGPLRYGTEVRLSLDAVAPALIAVAPAPLQPLAIAGPARARPGTVAEFSITPSRGGPKATRIVHLEAAAPDGTVMASHTRNLAVRAGGIIWRVTLAHDDPRGKWSIRVRDVLSGQTLERTLDVRATAGAGSDRGPR